MALAGGGSFTTLEPSRHTLTNIEVIRLFMEIPIRCALLWRGSSGRSKWGERVSNLACRGMPPFVQAI